MQLVFAEICTEIVEHSFRRKMKSEAIVESTLLGKSRASQVLRLIR